MEGFKEVNRVEGQESLSGVEKAQELLLELKTFNGTRIVGQDALNQVEALARELDEVLTSLPDSLRIGNQLPFNPVANSIPVDSPSNYQVAA